MQKEENIWSFIILFVGAKSARARREKAVLRRMIGTCEINF